MARYAVIGLGRFGMTVATILAENGMEVLAIDKKQELVDQISSKVAQAVCMDSTDENSLRDMNLNEVDAVIMAIGSNIQESILSCAILKKIGVGIIYAKIENHLHGRILELIGGCLINGHGTRTCCRIGLLSAVQRQSFYFQSIFDIHFGFLSVL